MDVELGKVREFAAAVRAGGPGLDLNDRHPPSSPTFLMSSAFWRRPEHEVIDHSKRFGRTLHAAEEFTFPTGPPRAGARLVGRSHIGSVTKKQGRRGGHMTFTEVVTVYTDESGSEVARNISTTVVVERPPATPGAATTCGDPTGE
jgi:N-terminal half of MaoC dehydratase